jgi:diamine N-acetyltransferase
VADHQPVALVILAKCHVRPGGHVWRPFLALDDGAPVGVAAVAVEGDRAHLRHVAVEHRRQGQGLGRKLVDALVAAIRRSHPACRTVVVTAHPDNEIALALYDSAGFRRTGTFDGIEPVLTLDVTSPPGPPAQ